MKLTVILMVWLFIYIPVTAQVASLAKQAVETVQHMPVSVLDVELPGSPFKTWFNQLVGSEAGVVWQLTECGESRVQQNGAERDLDACVEANAILSDGRQ